MSVLFESMKAKKHPILCLHDDYNFVTTESSIYANVYFSPVSPLASRLSSFYVETSNRGRDVCQTKAKVVCIAMNEVCCWRRRGQRESMSRQVRNNHSRGGNNSSRKPDEWMPRNSQEMYCSTETVAWVKLMCTVRERAI